MGVLLQRIDDGVMHITLNRPEALNALNLELKHELGAAIRAIADNDAARAVVLTGAGRAFCAGGDITEMDPSTPPLAVRSRQQRLLREVFIPLATLEKPVIAAVNGHAHGAGLALALACDIVLAAQSAILSFGFVHRGLSADSATAYFLPRRVGIGRAKELLFTGRRLTAAEAAQLAVVEGVEPDNRLLPTAGELAATFAGSASVAIGLTKGLVDASMNLTIHELAELEAYSQAVARSTDDHAEGVAAFIQRRPPRFVGH